MRPRSFLTPLKFTGSIPARSLFARLTLVCALLLLQHGALAHALTHLQDEQPDRSTEVLHHCDVCHAYAAAAHVTPGHGGLAELLPIHGAALFASVVLPEHPARVRIATRGPPARS